MSDSSSAVTWHSELPGPSCGSQCVDGEDELNLKSSSNSKSVDDDVAVCSDVCSLSGCEASAAETTSEVPTEEVEQREEQETSRDAPFAGELAFDRLLQRILTERMFELRRIQHGDRPVTGSRTRETLDNFFGRALNPNSAPPDNAALRPESVRDEVQSLSQSTVVSSVLRSQQFRQSLETALSGRVSSLAASSARLPRPPAARTAGPASALNRRPWPSVVTSQRQSPSPSSPSTPRPSPSSAALHTAPSPPPWATPRDAPSINADADPAAANQAHEAAYWNAMLSAGMRLLTESVNSDLNDLQGLRIVSSVLSGAFRHNLEALVQVRASEVGGGEQVRQHIGSLPRSSVPRAQPFPPTLPLHTSRGVSNGQLSGDVRQLQNEIKDLKHMLGLTFEMQMDTQRAIRQEVAAVFAAFMGTYSKQPGGASSAVSDGMVPRPPGPVSGGVCAVCLEKSVDTLLYKCGHLCVCHPCGLQLKMKGHHCPICRAPIHDVIRAYQTQ